jgi:hypothetical protein
MRLCQQHPQSRVTDLAELVETLERIAKGALVVDPTLVQELVSERRRNDPLAELSTLSGRCWRGWPRAARAQHFRQAVSPADRRRSPSGPGGGHLPGDPLTGSTGSPSPRLMIRARIASADRADLGTNPSTGLAAMRSV